MRQAILLLLNDQNGQATTHMKDFCAQLNRKKILVKGSVLNLDDDYQKSWTLYKLLKFGTGDIERVAQMDKMEENGVQDSEKQKAGVLAWLTQNLGPGGKKLYRQVMYGERDKGATGGTEAKATG